MLSCLTVIATVITGIGEVMTGSASTAVESLSSDFPVESAQIPRDADSSVHGWLVRGIRGSGVVLRFIQSHSNQLEMLS